MNNELNQLISLLDDNDLDVYNAVSNELLKQGLDVIPQLEKVWEISENIKIQERLESLIHNIRFSSTRTEIQKWILGGSKSLLEGAAYISQLQYPDSSFIKLNNEICRIASDVYLSSGQHLTAYEKVKLLNYVIYEINNFSRNTSNFYSPQNSFINQVLDNRKGTPISLGIIYLAVAREVGLPIYGVNLPKSFVLAYMDDHHHSNDNNTSRDVLFYINPYNKGVVLSRRDIDNYIKLQKLEPLQKYYVPCNNNSIIKVLIENLILAYKKMGFEEKVEPLEYLLVDFHR